MSEDEGLGREAVYLLHRLALAVEELRTQQDGIVARLGEMEARMDESLKQAITDITAVFGDMDAAIKQLKDAQAANAATTAEEQAAATTLEGLVTTAHETLAPAAAAAAEPATPAAPAPTTP